MGANKAKFLRDDEIRRLSSGATMIDIASDRLQKDFGATPNPNLTNDQATNIMVAIGAQDLELGGDGSGLAAAQAGSFLVTGGAAAATAAAGAATGTATTAAAQAALPFAALFLGSNELAKALGRDDVLIPRPFNSQEILNTPETPRFLEQADRVIPGFSSMPREDQEKILQTAFLTGQLVLSGEGELVTNVNTGEQSLAAISKDNRGALFLVDELGLAPGQQVTTDVLGGGDRAFLQNAPIENLQFVDNEPGRRGQELQSLISGLRQKQGSPAPGAPGDAVTPPPIPELGLGAAGEDRAFIERQRQLALGIGASQASPVSPEGPAALPPVDPTLPSPEGPAALPPASPPPSLGLAASPEGVASVGTADVPSQIGSQLSQASAIPPATTRLGTEQDINSLGLTSAVARRAPRPGETDAGGTQLSDQGNPAPPAGPDPFAQQQQLQLELIALQEEAARQAFIRQLAAQGGSSTGAIQGQILSEIFQPDQGAENLVSPIVGALSGGQ